MDFELNEDQKLLKDSAAQFTKSSPVTRMRKLRSHGSTGHGAHSDQNDPIGWEPSVWKQMADLGWLGLFYPEDIGGHCFRYGAWSRLPCGRLRRR